jgi:hypothetical protein
MAQLARSGYRNCLHFGSRPVGSKMGDYHGITSVIQGSREFASGVAKVAEPLSHGVQTFESGKSARLPEMCHGQSMIMTVLR